METERLLIRAYAEQDRENFIGLFTDRAVMRFVDNGQASEEKAAQVWEKIINGRIKNGYVWAVVGKADKKYIGHGIINPRENSDAEWEIGYILRKDKWGFGFATEIAERLIGFGFDDLKLRRVLATVDDDHSASIRVLVKAGMKFLRYEFDDRGRFSVFAIDKIPDRRELR
jgi:[ribosomal protein S5]-alanine N-acetyltransferase